VNGTAKPCSRCGPRFDFFTPREIAEKLKEIPISHVLAAEESVFNQRLEKCDKCEALREQVLCSYCGCFVMFRARVDKSYCPHPKGDKWTGLMESKSR
jgi:hypothetical protein